jgi:hypothetical protein
MEELEKMGKQGVGIKEWLKKLLHEVAINRSEHGSNGGIDA